MLLDEYRDRINDALESWPADRHFKLKGLLGTEWPERIGHRIVLGKQFRRAVEQREFVDVHALGEDGENHEWYVKR